jgi:hypothetical protein
MGNLKMKLKLYFLGYNAMHYFEIEQMFRSVTCFHAGFLLRLFFDLEMEATCPTETSADFRWTTRHYNHGRENLKS